MEGRVFRCKNNIKSSQTTRIFLLEKRRSPILPGSAKRRADAPAIARHFVYNDVGPVNTNFSAHYFRSVFSLPIRIFFFLSTKVRAVIVWRNSLSSTTHLFDPDHVGTMITSSNSPTCLGRQDAHSNGRSQLRPRNDSGCPAWEPWSSCA